MEKNSESDRFLASIPPGRQAEQARAVREAIRGNSAELEAIRRSRDIEKPLIAGVTRRMVREDLCLYLPESGAARETLVYLHGGCWTFGSINSCSEFCMAVAREGVAVLAYAYPLAPENDAQTIVARTGEAVSWAMDHASEWGGSPDAVAIGGDSAGGNLALVLCHRLKAAGRRLPGALVLMSPWTDMTMSGASYAERAESDPMLTPEYIEAVRTAYAGGRDYASPDLSPLFADLTGFPPTLVQAGDHEILYSDAEMLCHALERAGIPCRFEVSEGMWHVFQMFPLRKAAAAMESVARFLLER